MDRFGVALSVRRVEQLLALLARHVVSQADQEWFVEMVVAKEQGHKEGEAGEKEEVGGGPAGAAAGWERVGL